MADFSNKIRFMAYQFILILLKIITFEKFYRNPISNKEL